MFIMYNKYQLLHPLENKSKLVFIKEIKYVKNSHILFTPGDKEKITQRDRTFFTCILVVSLFYGVI